MRTYESDIIRIEQEIIEEVKRRGFRFQYISMTRYNWGYSNEEKFSVTLHMHGEKDLTAEDERISVAYEKVRHLLANYERELVRIHRVLGLNDDGTFKSEEPS